MITVVIVLLSIGFGFTLGLLVTALKEQVKNKKDLERLYLIRDAASLISEWRNYTAEFRLIDDEKLLSKTLAWYKRAEKP